MLTFLLRRLLSIPALLLVVSFFTFLLLRAAPGDYFQALEEDPAKTLRDVMSKRVAAGVAKTVPHERAVGFGVIRVANPRAGTEGQPTWLDCTFAPGGGLLCNGERLAPMRAKAVLSRFTVDGREHRLDEDGQVYVMIGSLEGYLRWIGNLARLDLGESYSQHEPVLHLIGNRVANTLILSLASLAFAWGLAIPLGVMSALRPNSLLDHVCGLIAYFGLSIPSVFFAMLMVLFAASTGWFPTGNMRQLLRTDIHGFAAVRDVAWHLVLPTIVIGTGTLAGYMRQMRAQMVETLSKDFVRTARAKGLPARTVLFKHALRNAINPLVTLFGFSIAGLLSGSFLVEVVMNWPGMARLVVEAIFSKDEPLVMTSVMVAALLLVVGNLVADLLLALVDPRIRVS